MRYYDIKDPYRRSSAYYQDEYVCLWEVKKEEIVSRWEWDDLVCNENWYEEIILPEFRIADRKSKALESELSDLFGKLSCESWS
jgi:hypothetical protein